MNLSPATRVLLLGVALALGLAGPAAAQNPALTDTVDPVSAANATPPSTNHLHTYRLFTLDNQSGQSPSYQYYYGRAQLDVRQPGTPAERMTLYTEAVAVPLNNPYTVSVTRRSDGASVVLGQMNVRGVSRRKLFTYLPAATPPTFRGLVEIQSLGLGVFSSVSHDPQQVLPAGFDVTDVASVTLTDSQGVARLSGVADAAKYDTRARIAHLRLTGQATAPAASAKVKVTHETFNTSSTPNDFFYLNARHLPAHTAVTLLINGQVAGEYVTTGHGRLLVTTYLGLFPHPVNREGGWLPLQKLVAGTNLSDVQAVSLLDTQGNILASGSL